jgi:hypothetical protein
LHFDIFIECRLFPSAKQARASAKEDVALGLAMILGLWNAWDILKFKGSNMKIKDANIWQNMTLFISFVSYLPNVVKTLYLMSTVRFLERPSPEREKDLYNLSVVMYLNSRKAIIFTNLSQK